MAITRFKQKPSTFEYEGVTVGLRKPITAEMEEIAKRRSAYMKTIVADIIQNKKDDTGLSAEGDAVLLLELQQYISGLLCCDPDDVTKPWFAESEQQQQQLASNGVERDIVSDVPAEFHMTAFAKFTGTYKEPDKGEQTTDTADVEGADKSPLQPQPQEPTSTSTSADSLPESQSGTESIPSASEIGGTTTSATESLTSSSS